MSKDGELDWLGPVLGFVGLLAGTLFFSSNNNGQQNNNNNNNLPPPPANAKPSGCGCSKKS